MHLEVIGATAIPMPNVNCLLARQSGVEQCQTRFRNRRSTTPIVESVFQVVLVRPDDAVQRQQHFHRSECGNSSCRSACQHPSCRQSRAGQEFPVFFAVPGLPSCSTLPSRRQAAAQYRQIAVSQTCKSTPDHAQRLYAYRRVGLNCGFDQSPQPRRRRKWLYCCGRTVRGDEIRKCRPDIRLDPDHQKGCAGIGSLWHHHAGIERSQCQLAMLNVHCVDLSLRAVSQQHTGKSLVEALTSSKTRAIESLEMTQRVTDASTRRREPGMILNCRTDRLRPLLIITRLTSGFCR